MLGACRIAKLGKHIDRHSCWFKYALLWVCEFPLNVGGCVLAVQLGQK